MHINASNITFIFNNSTVWHELFPYVKKTAVLYIYLYISYHFSHALIRYVFSINYFPKSLSSLTTQATLRIPLTATN